MPRHAGGQRYGARHQRRPEEARHHRCMYFKSAYCLSDRALTCTPLHQVLPALELRITLINSELSTQHRWGLHGEAPLARVRRSASPQAKFMS